MGSKLSAIADKQSEKYKQLKNRYDEIEADIQEIISYLDGSYDAKKIIEDAKKAKDERDKAISRKGTKSKELEERLEILEFKREEEIQKIRELRGRINRINLLSEDEGHDEVSQKAEAWKIQNEMVKCSLNLKTINARIGMTKIRKSNQDAKDIENIKKVIDTYNEKITEYKKEMDELNNERPKSVPERFMRENDWILGVVTIDKNKKLQEVVDKIDEENREIREFGQEKYFERTQKEDWKLPYKKLNNEERNEIIKYSEEMTTFKQLRDFLKIKAARAAGKVVGLTILAVRKIKSIFKPKEDETQNVVEATPNPVEQPIETIETESTEQVTEELTEQIETDSMEQMAEATIETIETEPTKQVVEESIEQITTDPMEQIAEVAIEPIEQIEEASETLIEESKIEIQEPANGEILENLTEKPDAENKLKSATKVKVKRVEKNNVEAKGKAKTPIRVRVAVGDDVKRAIEATAKAKSEEQNAPKRELYEITIDESTLNI